jgi:hypothetical protein
MTWKVLGIAILCVLSIALLLRVVVPAAAMFLGLGIDVSNNWQRSWRSVFVYSHPGVSLFIGIVLLYLFCWGVVRLVKL